MTQMLVQPTLVKQTPPSFQEAWVMVASQLRLEMRQGEYETWVQPLQPLSFNEGVFRLGGVNTFAIRWAEDHLRARITRLLDSLLNQPVTLRFSLIKDKDASHGEAQSAAQSSQPEGQLPLASMDDASAIPADGAPTQAGRRKKKTLPADGGPSEGGSPRKIQLQRAYGTERARVIQPERGMFLTMYFFNNWLPLLGHSALTTILAARSLCYWNPMTGELRNVIETDMTELAHRADVSVRTVKDVLNHPLVKQYFLRYKVRRVMTPNGVRTAGIVLQVRMDDPLTPEDQEQHKLAEEERWYTADFEDEEEA